jgi:hypothetical protein
MFFFHTFLEDFSLDFKHIVLSHLDELASLLYIYKRYGRILSKTIRISSEFVL